MTFAVSHALGTTQLPLLALIDLYCHNSLPSHLVPPIMSILVSLIESEEYLPTLEHVINKVNAGIEDYPGSNIGDSKVVSGMILSKLCDLDSLDAFYDFLNDMTKLLIDPPLDLIGGKAQKVKGLKTMQSNSFLGKFLLNIILNVKVMDFKEMLMLWKAFCEYRKPFMQIEQDEFWKRIRPECEIIDQVISQDDLKNLFDFQLNQLQRSAAEVPEDVQNILKMLTQRQRNGANKSYYIEYLQYWLQGDYENALNSLHRYFDYMMSSKQNYYYHYALLALASLHASFGCEQEALRAINEAIMVAREARDSNCLNYLLSWLFNFLNDSPHLEKDGEMNRDQILDFLELKSKMRHNSTLHCISFMDKAHMSFLKGMQISEVNHNLLSASYLALNSQRKNYPNEMNNIIQVSRLMAKMWWICGTDYIDLFDVYLGIAEHFASKSNDWNELVEIHLLKAKKIFVTDNNYQEAIDLLTKDEYKVKQNINLYKQWKTKFELIRLENMIKTNGNKHEATFLLSNIESLGKELNNIEISFEIGYIRAQYFIWKGHFNEACEILTGTMSDMKSNSTYNNYWFCQYQLLYGKTMNNRGKSIIMNVIENAKTAGYGLILREAKDILSNL